MKMVERPHGPATVLAIGTANPPNVFHQHQYPDFYFDITNSNHMTQLKQKFRRICGHSGIKKRHMVLNEEILKANPSICAYMEASLDARQDVAVTEVPKLGKEAAEKAIKEWGQPKCRITHLVFCTAAGMNMPGADWALIRLLGLRPSVKRHMMYHLGCYAGGTAMRVAKDVAENNKGARVLVVCSETLHSLDFRGPSEAHVGNLVGQALFGDGAAAVIVGSDPVPTVERPLYEIHWAGSRILPDSEKAVQGRLGEVGSVFSPSRELPQIISSNVGEVLRDALESFFNSTSLLYAAAAGAGRRDDTTSTVAMIACNELAAAGGRRDDTATINAIPYSKYSLNDMFWIVHPGGRAILDAVEERLQLKAEKLAASRHVLSEYGNMSSASVLFIMDEMRKRSSAHHRTSTTTGEGCDWGVLLSFGPGVTCETVILKAISQLAY